MMKEIDESSEKNQHSIPMQIMSISPPINTLMTKPLYFLFFLFVMSCSGSKNPYPDLPDNIKHLSNELIVTHSTDTVCATLNTKDPETRGKYQLKHTTSVRSDLGDVQIEEFGGCFLVGDQWVLKTIYDRPFNADEFSRWYNCPNGQMKKGKSYQDSDNWLSKMNSLSGDTTVGLWYYVGKDANGKKVMGAKDIVRIARLR